MSDYERCTRDLRAELTEHGEGVSVRPIVCERCGRKGARVVCERLGLSAAGPEVCLRCREAREEEAAA